MAITTPPPEQVLRFLPEFEPEGRTWSFVSHKRRASVAAKQASDQCTATSHSVALEYCGSPSLTS